MRLIRARVQNYRSVEDSTEFEFPTYNEEKGNLLGLVGKNEAGKTAILYGLAGLNPHPLTPIRYNKEIDYPRRYLTEYERRHVDGHAEVVRTWWRLDDHEKRKIFDALGPNSISDTPLIITRHYEDKGPRWGYPINETGILQYFIEETELTADEKKPIIGAASVDELRSSLEKLGERTGKQEALLARIRGIPNGNPTGHFKAVLNAALPQFMYFSHYDRMAGELRVDNLAQRNEQNKPLKVEEQIFLDFLKFAGTTIDELSTAGTYEVMNARCEAASNAITDQLRAYWTQNPFLEVEVRLTKAEPKDPPPLNEGVIARARIKNTLHRVSVPFSERSAGFIWFFSFLVKFAEVQKTSDKLVFLLDEPGLTLHGKAQEDLLRYFNDKLLPKHQVVYSTHSPFMVPADALTDMRIVEDKISISAKGAASTEGTKVREDVLAVDPDTLFPLQGALGYSITQTLFVGKHTLLVEGPGDLLYLQAWSSALKGQKREFLDKRWTICPAGGIDKIQSFVSLFAGAKLDLAAITDFAKSDKKKLDNLRKTKILKEGRLITYADVLGALEADVEDIFSPESYAMLLNECFALPAAQQLNAAKLKMADTTTMRIVKQAEASFRTMPAGTPEFDHYYPAEWLIRNPLFLNPAHPEIGKTLDNAAKVVAALNKFLA